MDEAFLKTLLASQDQAFRTSLEIFLKQVEEKIQALHSSVGEVTRSLEFTQKEVEDLKQEVKQREREDLENKETIKQLHQDLQASQALVKELEDRCNYQEDYSRRNNLQIIGIEEHPGESWEQTAIQVTRVLEDKLELPNIQLERAHRVGQRSEHGNRPIIARFSRYSDREAVMRNVFKLRGSRIFINEDLCPASQAIKKAQLPQLKSARSQGKIAYFRHTKLIIKDKTSAPAQEAPIGGIQSSNEASVGSVQASSGSKSAPSAAPDCGGGFARDQGSAHERVAAHARDVGGDGESSRGSITGVSAAGAWGLSAGKDARVSSPVTDSASVLGTPAAGVSGSGRFVGTKPRDGTQRPTRAASRGGHKKN